MTMPRMAIDPYTGEETDEDNLNYLNTLRDSLAQGVVHGTPNDDGSWNIGVPQQAEPEAPPMLPPPEPPPEEDQTEPAPPPPAPEPPPAEEEEPAPGPKPPSGLESEPLSPEGFESPPSELSEQVARTVRETPRALNDAQSAMLTHGLSDMAFDLSQPDRDQIMAAYEQGSRHPNGSVDPVGGYLEAAKTSTMFHLADLMVANGMFNQGSGDPANARLGAIGFISDMWKGDAKTTWEDIQSKLDPNSPSNRFFTQLITMIDTAPLFAVSGGATMPGMLSTSGKVVLGSLIGIPAGEATQAGMEALGAPSWAVSIARTTAEFAPMTLMGGLSREVIQKGAIGQVAKRAAVESVVGGVGSEAYKQTGLPGQNLPVIGNPGGLFSVIVAGKFYDFAQGYRSIIRTGKPDAHLETDPAIGAEILSNHNAVLNAKGDDLVTVYHAVPEQEALRLNSDGLNSPRPYENVPDSLMGFRKDGTAQPYAESNYKHSQPVKVTFEGDAPFFDEVKGLNQAHALERARRNWEGATIEAADHSEVTSDPRVALTDALGKGVQDPQMVAYQVPRKMLGAVKDGFFKVKGSVFPVENEAVNGWLPNAAAMVKNFLMSERGAFGRPEEAPLDPRTAEILGIDQSAKGAAVPSSAQFMGNTVEFANSGDTAATSGMQDVSRQLKSDYDDLSKLEMGDLTSRYQYWRKEAAKAQDELDSIMEPLVKHNLLNADGQADMLSQSHIENARQSIYESLQMVQSLGEELNHRTNGQEGVGVKIGRAIRQFMAEEEGAIRIPGGRPDEPQKANLGWRNQSTAKKAEQSKGIVNKFFDKGPLGWQDRGEQGGVNLGNFIPETPNYTVNHQPAQATVQLLNIDPINPHLTLPEKSLNILKNTFHIGTLDDPLMTRLIEQYKRVKNGVIVNRSVAGANQAKAILHYYFKADKDGQLLDLPDRPTIQDVAAQLPKYAGMLKPEQLYALERLRKLTEPYKAALKEQGIEIDPRIDIDPNGGFYLPRGSTLEDQIDYSKWGIVPARNRGLKARQEQQAVWPTMGEAIDKGERYIPFDHAMGAYMKDMADRVLNAHIGNVLKNTTDDAGRPISDTAEARLLRQNPKLASRINRLQKSAATLGASVENLDNQIHSAIINFANTPAPDLDNLRDALGQLSTANGKLRIKGRTEAQMQDNFRILRKSVKEEVFRNMGRYKGWTGEQARRMALKDALDAVKIRRGRFKGMDFDQGKAQLDFIKNEIQALQPQWQAAKQHAQLVPEEQARIEPMAFGKNVQNYSFPDAVASVANKYLQNLGPPKGAGTASLRVWGATNNFLRMMRSTGDISGLGIQGLLGAFHEPEAYGRAAGNMFKSMMPGGDVVLGKYIDDFDIAAARDGTPTSQDWARSGVRIGSTTTEFTEGGKFGRLPGILQSNRGFGTFGDILRLDGVRSQYEIKKLSNMPPDEQEKAMRELANWHNMMTGWSPGRTLGDVGNLVTFAPRFLQSQFEVLANMLNVRSMTGDQARRAMLKMIGMGTLMTIAANDALGNSSEVRATAGDLTGVNLGGKHGGYNYLQPFIDGPNGKRFNPNFMHIRAAGRDLSLFGPWDSLLRATASLVLERDVGYIARTKASPTIALMWDVLSGKGFLGNDTPTINHLLRGEDFDLLPDFALRSFLPFALGEPIADVVSGKKSVGQAAIDVGINMTGVKAQPLTPAETYANITNRAVKEMLDSGYLSQYIDDPAALEVLTNAFKQGGDAVTPTERKLIDRYVNENYPLDREAYHEARRANANVYQRVSDQSDTARESVAKDMDDLFKQLIAGGDQKQIWDAYTNKRNELAGRLKEIYEGTGTDAKEYQTAVSSLRPNDVRGLEDVWQGIVNIPANYRGGNIDWDSVDAMREAFVNDIKAADPQLAQRFLSDRAIAEKLNFDAAHPMTQLKQTANQQLKPYFDLIDVANSPDSDSATAKDSQRQADQFLRDNSQLDFLKWMTSASKDPTLHSVEALAIAAQATPNRKMRLEGGSTVIDDIGLQLLQQYGNEITQLTSMPASMTRLDGSKFSPVTALRQRDPLYDALYYYLGYSSPDAKNSVPVYHPGAVANYMQQWGVQRTDGAKIRAAQ